MTPEEIHVEDPTPASPAERAAAAAGPNALLWLGVLVVVCALIVLVLQRRRASMRGNSGEFPSETVQVDQTAREVAPETMIADAAKVDALAFATSAAELDQEIEALTSQAGEVHSHKRLRRHPELARSIDANV